LDIEKPSEDYQELFLNVAYKLKKSETLVPAGYALAKQQLEVKPWKFEELVLTNCEAQNQAVVVPEIKENDENYLRIFGENFNIDFSRKTGFLTRFDVNGKAVLKEGSTLSPNFWRAPTDNDYGAKLQLRYSVWQNPELKLTGLKADEKDQLILVNASYELPEVSGKLDLKYEINNVGEILVTQSLAAGENADVSEMFRFGMKMEMPEEYAHIKYYGRGPIENYIDRKYSQFVGLYEQDVCEQFYSYIRPQENGTKSDLRWWKQTTVGGTGLAFVSDDVFSASALKYTQESLDDGIKKDQRHSQEVPKSDFITVCIDKVQMGLGCVNSWGAIPREEYRIPYQDYEFSFLISPIQLK